HPRWHYHPPVSASRRAGQQPRSDHRGCVETGSNGDRGTTSGTTNSDSMKIQLAPSMLSADFARLADEIKTVEKHADLLHVDVMDGHFVPNITLGPQIVKACRAVSELP